MAKKISNKDIFEDGLFAPAKKNAEALNKELIKLEAGLKGIAAVAKSDLKKLKIVNFSDVQKGTKAIKEIDAAYKGLSEVEKQRLKLREQERKVGKQLQAARSKEFRQLQETNLAKRNQNKLVKAEIIENSRLSSEYERQSAKLNRLRKNLKNLILTEGESSAKTKKLAAEVGKLDTKLKNADAAAGQFQRNVGNYPKGLKGAIGSLKNLAGALGITAGIAGLVRAMGNAVKIAKDFEQGNANLAAVLGKTKDQIGALTADAKRLGAATAFSATQVSGLQVEFAKLGFTEKQILAATEATLSLAAATGSDLGEAAAITGATLGGFGLKADQTQRVVDVMAKSFSTSALDIEKFKESMKTAAPAASAVGINVEKTTALLGTLANAGISGSMAGNALSKSFIELNKKGLTLEQGLEKVANSENKLGAAVDLVGVNAAKSFLVLAKGTDSIKELEIGLNDAGGAAEKMAKEQLDTLEGSLTILNSAWEGFVLGLLSGDSAFNSISKSIVEGTTALLGFLTSSEAINKEWLTQRENIKSLNVEILNNSDRYDELKGKAELTKDEQIELDGIIQKLAEDVPTAVTEFDKYGKALDISTTATRRFAEQQKNLLLVTNADKIEETEDAIKSLQNELKTQGLLYKETDDGLLKYNRQLDKATNGSKTFAKATTEEVAEFVKKKASLQDLIDGNILYLAQLKGEKTEAEAAAEAVGELTQAELDELAALEKAEAERKAAAEKAAAAEKKRAEELEKLRLQGLINEQEQLDAFLDAKETAENEFFESQLEKELQEIRAVEEKYNNLIQQGENYNAIALANGEELVVDLTQLTEDEQAQIAAIKKKYRDAEAAENAKLMAELEAQAKEEIDLEKKKAKEKAEADAKQREEQLKIAKEYLELTSEAFSDEIDKEEKEQDEAIKRREESVALQQSRAEQGLENTLAFEKEQLAKAELERARTAEKRAKQEEALALAQAFLNAFAARSKDDPDTAAAKALTDVILAKALSETVAGAFAEGVEDFQGKGTGTSDSNLIRFSHGESVVTAKGTKENQGLVTAMNNGDVGSWFANNMMLSPLSSEKNYDSFGILAQKIESIEKAIKNRPTSQTNLDNMGNVMQSTYRNGVKNTVKYLNARPRI